MHVLFYGKKNAGKIGRFTTRETNLNPMLAKPMKAIRTEKRKKAKTKQNS
jgi:hypothetical protein